MSDSRKELERVFKLIKRDKNEEALKTLRPMVSVEPENVDAWWLLAYAATEPKEVREALVKVLRLDPHYSNAPKAREMLEKLNEEYPPSADEIMQYPELQSSFPDVFAEEEDIFAENTYDLESFIQQEPIADIVDTDLFASNEPAAEDIFGGVEFQEIDDSFLADDSAFSGLETEAFMPEEEPQEEVKRSKEEVKRSKRASADRTADLKRTLDALDAGEVTDEDLAEIEEQVGRQQGRGRRLLMALVGLVLVAALVVVILFIAFPGEETKDPGELKVISLDSDAAAAVKASTQGELSSNTLLGPESEALFAESELGNALFIKICGRPNTSFRELVTDGMTLAAQQASAVQDSVAAVGISIEACGAAEHDTLYRAVVSVSDAARYQNGEIDWVAFQRLWKTA